MAQNQLTQPIDLVLIGGSSGSIDVLLHLLPALQPTPPFAILIVVHRKNTTDSALAQLLSHRCSLPLVEVDDKEPIRAGTVYLAPADYHVLLEQDGTFSLDDSEKVHYSRPSIDVSFESAADVYGPSVAAILLSGANMDGTNGLAAIKQAGGITVVQQPETAQVAFMPQQAIDNVPIDYVLDVPQLVDLVNRLGLRSIKKPLP